MKVFSTKYEKDQKEWAERYRKLYTHSVASASEKFFIMDVMLKIIVQLIHLR